MREREVKLAVAPTFRLPDLNGDGLQATVGPPEHLDTVYLDTEDLRLTRAGVSLRHRSAGGWTLKLPAPGAGAVLERDEHSVAGKRTTAPPALLDLVTAYARGAELRAVAHLRTVRTPIHVDDGDGGPVALVTDDEVSILDDRRVAARFREVEVEAAGDDMDVVEALVARLRAAGAGEPEPIAKVVRALGPRATEPPDVVAGELGDDATAAAAVRTAIAASVARLITHDAPVRLGEDVEGVHQMRVATRRLRSDLRTFSELLEPGWVAELRAELSWLADLLGGVRDADVLVARLERAVATLPGAVQRSSRPLFERLQRDHEAHRDELLSALRSPRFVTLIDALVDAARAPRSLDGAQARAVAALPALVNGPYERLAKAIADLPRDPPDAALHELRIRAKRARYAAEAAAPVIGPRARRFALAAADLQDVLGEHQDAVVAADWLATNARGKAAFAAGWLAAGEAAAARAAAGSWRPVWRRVRARRPSTWT